MQKDLRDQEKPHSTSCYTCIDPWPQNSNEDIPTWQTACSFDSQLSGGCAHRARHPGTSEMSFLPKPPFRKWIWTDSWSHLLTQSLPSFLALNVFSVGEWWQWGVGRQIQISGCSSGFNSLFEGNWAPHKGHHQPNYCPHTAYIFLQLAKYCTSSFSCSCFDHFRPNFHPGHTIP